MKPAASIMGDEATVERVLQASELGDPYAVLPGMQRNWHNTVHAYSSPVIHSIHIMHLSDSIYARNIMHEEYMVSTVDAPYVHQKMHIPFHAKHTHEYHMQLKYT